MQSLFMEGLIQCGIKSYQAIGDKTRNVGLAGAFGHAARNHMPVAAGGICHDGSDHGLLCDDGFTGFFSM